MKYVILLLLLISFLLGCAEKESPAEKEVKLKMYDFRYKSFQAAEEILIEKYRSAPIIREVTFNRYKIAVEVLANGKKVEYGGKIYTAEFGRYNSSVEKGERFTKIGDANVMILKIEFKRDGEGNIPPPEINVKSNLFFILFGVPIPGLKEATLTKIEPRIAFEDGFVEPWNYALEKDKICGFDTNSSIESYTSFCLFTYPSDKMPKEIVISAFPSEKITKAAFSGLGYPVARIPLG